MNFNLPDIFMKTLALLITLWGSILLMNAGAAEITAVPYPQSVITHEDFFTITQTTRIVLGDGSTDAERFLAGEIQQALNGVLGVLLPIVEGDAERSAGDIFIGLVGVSNAATDGAHDRFTGDMDTEGYVFTSGSDGVLIAAKSSAGLYYGGMTLMQLIENGSPSGEIPGLIISDYPHYRFRGISDDISRGQVSTLENFKHIVERLARYKQNVYMPYLEDMFRFESHPRIGEGRGALTREQVIELDRFAREHHVEIIPIFQTLGHMENMLLLREYVEYAEFPGAASLNVSDERIYDLLQEFLDEIVPAFSSKYFHMAADESWDVGRGASKELVDRSGIADVHARHFNRVYEMLKAMGKEVIMYGDIATGLGTAVPGYPEVLEQLPDDIIMVYWDYWPQRSYAEKARIFKKAGQPFMVSPGVGNWHPIYPDNLTAPVNIRNMAQTGVETGAVGFINSSWGDYGGETLRELNWFGYAYGAEVSWSPRHDSLEEFSHRYLRDFFGTGDNRLAAIYFLLAQIGNTITNLELWRPPFMPPAGTTSWNLSPQFLSDFYRIKQQIPLVHSMLDELINREAIPRNSEYLDYLRFSVERAELYVRKIESAKIIADFMTTDVIDDTELQNAMALCDTMITNVERLQESFVKLWKRTNIGANLDNLITYYYRRQISYWGEKREQLAEGIYWVEPLNPGKFIYHPEATPYVSRGTRKPHVYFRKSFTVDDIDKLDRMMVQTVGDTYLDIYVNGQHVGESYAKRALSLIVQMARTRFWDITEFLVPGENVIAIEARNYLHAGSAGLSWYSELVHTDGTVTGLHSDDTWKVYEPADAPGTTGDVWYTPGYNDSGWPNARIADERVPLLDRPNFKDNRTSWIVDRVWTATLQD
jgi:hexosaminidase